jgi:myo-inositol 2-dehydrogenase/D-chiro-inositol 1-dehydrogenase
MGTHQRLILQGLNAGKHVFCEKPMAETTEGVRLCYDTAKSTGKTLFCAFNRRFDSSFRDAYDRVRSGKSD